MRTQKAQSLFQPQTGSLARQNTPGRLAAPSHRKPKESSLVFVAKPCNVSAECVTLELNNHKALHALTSNFSLHSPRVPWLGAQERPPGSFASLGCSDGCAVLLGSAQAHVRVEGLFQALPPPPPADACGAPQAAGKHPVPLRLEFGRERGGLSPKAVPVQACESSIPTLPSPQSPQVSQGTASIPAPGQ